MSLIQKLTSLNRGLLYGAAGVTVLLAARALYKEATKYSVKDKVVLITGGSRGLGLVLARMLAAKGARLAICGRSAEALEKAKEELEATGAEVIAVTADVTRTTDVNRLINKVIRHYGAIDILINNAGIIQVAPYEATEVKDYKEAMQTNFWGPLYTIFGVLPHMRNQGGGRIVNVTSIGGKIAVPHLLPYTASKFALVGLSEGLHASLKESNILVTTVVPTLMRTGSTRNITVKGDHAKEYAWFKVSSSSALLSVKAETAASSIIKAIEYGRSEATIGLTTKLATFIQGLAPGFVSEAMAMVERLLPQPGENYSEVKTGYESESALSAALGKRSTTAALKNNEI
jgi:short-subunit dehydrogenase